MKKILSLLVAYFVLVGQAFAVMGVPDNLHWLPAGFGGAGRYSMIIPDHFTANKVYAIPDVNAPYVSTNKGELWQFLSWNAPSVSKFGTTQTAAFVQSKTTATLMFAIDSQNNGLYRSADGGQTWTKVGPYKNAKGFKSIAIDPTDDNKVYVASQANGSTLGGRIWRSTDAGLTFSEYFRPFDLSVTSESAELNGSTNTRTGKLNNLNNILKGSVVFTSSGGETFTDNGDGVLVSNMGWSGTITYNTPSSTSYGNYSLTFGSTPSTTTVDYTVSYSPGFVYVSQDGADIIVGRNASSGTTLVKYNIAGGTTTPITLTGTNATYNGHYDTYVDGSSVEHLCVTAGLKVACSSDFSSWSYTAATTATTTYYINTFAVNRQSDSDLSFVISRRLISSQYTSAQQYSNDSGATWSTVSTSKNSTMNPTQIFTSGSLNVSHISADPFDENVFYFATDWMLVRSDNGGANFYEKDSGAQNIVQEECAIAPTGEIFCTSMDTGIQSSTDFAVTWTQEIPNATQPYVTSSANSMGGHYWSILTLGTKEEWDAGTGKVVATATMYGNNNAIYFKNAVIYSHDSGSTWSRTFVGLPTADLYGDIIWDHGYARAMAKSADESVIYIGMDGENCNADGTGGLASDNCSTSTYGTANNNHTFGGLFKSTDGGITWEQVWYTPRKIYNALDVDPTDTTGRTLLFGTFGYNLYHKSKKSETAELNGSGSTRTGSLNQAGVIAGTITITDAGGEIFTDSYTELGTNTLSSNMGGSGTINYSTREYSLTYGTTPSTATASYDWRGYVGDSSGPGNFIYDVAYDYEGKPYAVTSNSGAAIYRSVTTVFGDGSGSYGTWQLMKRFTSTGILDGLAIDPRNKNRIFVSSTLGQVSDRRIWVTVDAKQHTNAKWYDITGDFPVVGGCQSLMINYFEGEKGYLYCSSNGGGLWKLSLDDSPATFPGRTVIGGRSLE